MAYKWKKMDTVYNEKNTEKYSSKNATGYLCEVVCHDNAMTQ